MSLTCSRVQYPILISVKRKIQVLTAVLLSSLLLHLVITLVATVPTMNFEDAVSCVKQAQRDKDFCKGYLFLWHKAPLRFVLSLEEEQLATPDLVFHLGLFVWYFCTCNALQVLDNSLNKMSQQMFRLERSRSLKWSSLHRDLEGDIRKWYCGRGKDIYAYVLSVSLRFPNQLLPPSPRILQASYFICYPQNVSTL